MKQAIIAFITLVSCFFSASSSAQKKVIDADAIQDWERLGQSAISENGKYVWFEIVKPQSGDSLIVTSIDGKYRRGFANGKNPNFSNDSKKLIFTLDDDVYQLNLPANKLEVIKRDCRYEMHTINGDNLIIFYSKNEIELRNLKGTIQYKYPLGYRFFLNRLGSEVIIGGGNELRLLHFDRAREEVIYKGSDAEAIAFDPKGTGLAFICKTSGNKRKMCYYSVASESTTELVSDSTLYMYPNLRISDNSIWFSRDGAYIFFKMAYSTFPYKIDSGIVKTDKVDIWHYRDKYLQSNQLLTLNDWKHQTFTGCISVISGKVIKLENTDYKLVGQPRGKYVVLRSVPNYGEALWNEEHHSISNLLNLETGESRHITSSGENVLLEGISPTEKYLILRDTSEQNLYSYELSTGRRVCITKGMNDKYVFKNSGYSNPLSFLVAGWLKDDEAIIIYDRYDIWMVDPKGRTNPIVITANYGRMHKISLRFAFDAKILENLRVGDSVLLTGLEDSTRHNGFFRTRLAEAQKIGVGKLYPCLYYFPRIFLSEPPAPVKAENSQIYLVQRQTEKDAPNLYVTRDFVDFRALSNVAPNKDFNWMTAELVRWTAKDGLFRYGILYKPDLIDTSKKYPLIFTYYEMRSNERYQFRSPGFSIGELNIPWYVSRGYLVFVPDIWQDVGHTGESALNSITSAADYLIKSYNFIDKDRLGLQGHSFGGFETNYIVTHSTMFAAAQSSAGISNCISGYGSLGFGQQSLTGLFEMGQLNLQTTPWDRPDIYIENSPIYHVHKVTTPLLLMHNKDDGSVPFTQSVELFIALRRLKKSVWLIQYDDQGHTLDGNSASAIDFTIRQQQFFDFYLKNANAPFWLKQGVPAWMKGVVSGLDY